MDAEAEVAMAEFSEAAALLRDETLPKKERWALQRRCKEASFRRSALTFAMRAFPARTKRGLLAQIRELGGARCAILSICTGCVIVRRSWPRWGQPCVRG